MLGDKFWISKLCKDIECDKPKLVTKCFSEKFNNFKLPNLISIKFVDNTFRIQFYLKILFSSNNLCSNLKELDLSGSGLTDNGMLRIKNNIDKIKNIEIINFENTLLTIKSKKYLNFFSEKKIKILLDINKLTIPDKAKNYNIFLGGSTSEGKTCYSVYCSDKHFLGDSPPTSSITYLELNPSFDKNIQICLFDTMKWIRRYHDLIRIFLLSSHVDGIILLFDISIKEDFEGLKDCLSFIKDIYELEDFPVLLIANKIDRERQVEKEEIEKFQKDNNLIGYFEASCKTGKNIIESLDFMIDYLIKKEKEDYNLK